MVPNFENCKQTAYKVLEKTVEYGFPLDFKKVIKESKMKICLVPYANTPDPQILQLYTDDGFSALSNDKYIIYYNEKKPLLRLRWTIAHELGHILLGHLQHPEWDNSNHNTFEKEANFFAKCLLSPPVLIFQMPNYLDTVDEKAVSKVFGISEQAANYLIDYCNEYKDYIEFDVKRYQTLINSSKEELKKACTSKYFLRTMYM